MPFFEGIEENFRFLILEVIKQLEFSREALRGPVLGQMEKAEARDDYVDNLKSVIEKKAFGSINDLDSRETKKLHFFRALISITGNLERIADYCVNIVGQTRYLKDGEFPTRYEYASFYDIIIKAIQKVEQTLKTGDIKKALDICRVEFITDELYSKIIVNIIDELKTGENTEDLLTTLFIYRYLERIGDALLNVGEAIIYSVIGEKLKIHQYQALKKTLEPYGEDEENPTLTIQNMGETKSGGIIERISGAGVHGGERGIIYKDGQVSKLRQEKANIEKWYSIRPDIPPKIFGYEEEGQNASILLEYLEGKTLQDIILGGDDQLLKNAFAALFEALNGIWLETKVAERTSGDYVGQLLKRINDVIVVHPEFKKPHYNIASQENLTIREMVKELRELDDKLSAPFAVFIHGDFNNDNIIYNEKTNGIHFIDLNRSRMMDYVQDTSVFMVSNFRMPFFKRSIREKLDRASIQFYQFAGRFAKENGDDVFEARLALGLIRSFFTSTRFVLDGSHSKTMYLRTIYLLEKMRNHFGENRPAEEFRLPENIIVY